MAKRGRPQLETCTRGHQRTPENVIEKVAYQATTGAPYILRTCRVCRRERERLKYRRAVLGGVFCEGPTAERVNRFLRAAQ